MSREYLFLRVHEPLINGSLVVYDVLFPVHMPPQVSNDLGIIFPKSLAPENKLLLVVEMDGFRNLGIVHYGKQKLIQLTTHIWERGRHIVKFLLVQS